MFAKLLRNETMNVRARGKLWVLLASSLLILGLQAEDLYGGTLYGVASFGDFYSVNTQTGAASFIGDAAPGLNATMSGLDADHGIVYMMSGGSPTTSLFTVDVSTAAATYVTQWYAVGFFGGLAFDSQNGLLYAAQESHTAGENELWSINPNTGQSTFIGYLTGSASWCDYISGLAYDPGTDTLYASTSNPGSRLLTVDKSTAATTVVGSIGYGYVTGLTFAPDTGVLYGASEPYGTSGLISINPDTGAGTLIGPTGVGIFGLAYTPEPATMALLGLGGLGVILRRKRR